MGGCPPVLRPPAGQSSGAPQRSEAVQQWGALPLRESSKPSLRVPPSLQSSLSQLQVGHRPVGVEGGAPRFETDGRAVVLHGRVKLAVLVGGIALQGGGGLRRGDEEGEGEDGEGAWEDE